MSKRAGRAKTRDRDRDRRPREAAPAKAVAPSQPPVEFLPPLKPRPRLFYALLTGIALWVGVLLGLYFVTVYPNRDHAKSDRPTDAPPEDTVSR